MWVRDIHGTLVNLDRSLSVAVDQLLEGLPDKCVVAAEFVVPFNEEGDKPLMYYELCKGTKAECQAYVDRLAGLLKAESVWPPDADCAAGGAKCPACRQGNPPPF